MQEKMLNTVSILFYDQVLTNDNNYCQNIILINILY